MKKYDTILYFDNCNMLLFTVNSTICVLFEWKRKRILTNITSAHVRLLPEFKHINEGRKRN